MKVPLRTTMSHSPSPRMAWPWLWLLLLWSSFGVCLAKQEEGAKTSKKITTVCTSSGGGKVKLPFVNVVNFDILI